VLALALLFVSPVVSVASDDAAASIPVADVVTMTGEYYWHEGNNEGVLEKVIFSPTGEGTWDVVFHFRFRGRNHVFRGTAEGSLTAGPLEGKIRNESEKRSFAFSGAFKDGTFEGTHSEIKRGRARPTGTMILNG
jgi:hypothetical protein